MMSIAICDDERLITQDIYQRLEFLKPEYTIHSFNSAQDLLNSKTNYDIIFLDIEMPHIDGMETAKQIRKRNKDTYIIFLTSHTKYMTEAFKVRAYRFLVKPVSEDDLTESITQAELELLGAAKILVKADEKTDLINIDDIICIEAFGDGAIIYTTNLSVESNKSLKFWTEKLPAEHFYRVHKTYLISYRYVKTVESTSIIMNQLKAPVPISRRNQSAFKKALVEYVKKYSKFI